MAAENWFQYKTASAGSWTNVPISAYYGTFSGTLDLVYPKPQSFTVAGRPCAMVGLPYIHIYSSIMTASGFKFWTSQFSGSKANYDSLEFWLSTYNTYDYNRTNWGGYTGWLQRPTYERLNLGNSDNNTMYYGVEINLLHATSAS